MLRAELFQDLPITVIRGDDTCAHITDLTEDSRTVMPGSLFIARTGLKSDGLEFVQAAIDAGAAAVLIEKTADQSRIPDGPLLAVCDDVRMMTALLAERIFGNPSDHLLIAGITGTNGKSTIAHLVHGLLNRCGIRTGVIGTVGIDDGAEYVPSPMTTPPAIELSRILATMRDAGCRACIMEVSSHALDQHRAGAINFDAAVFTNLTGDHADYHPTIEHYLQSKQRLLEMVSQTGLAVLNADDPVVAASAIPKARTHLCALDPTNTPNADWTIERTQSSIAGETLSIKLGLRTINAAVPLFGPFNAMNILQSVAVAWELLGRAGFDENDRCTKIQNALSLATSPTGRLEPIHGPGDDVSVFVDFAHTDDALDRALAAVRTASDKETQLTAVFGCGGDRDQHKRPRMGAAAAAHADRIIITSDNPRSEPPDEIVSAILEGVPIRARSRVTIHIDRERAIREAIAHAAPGGAIVIAGKGHETDQVTADENGRPVTRRFIDQNIAREALRDRRTMTNLVRTDRLDPEAIAEITNGRWLTKPDPQRTILGAAIDSRDIRPGNIFFAFKGAHTDGHAYLEAAARAGAATLILEIRPPDLNSQLREHPDVGVLLVKSSADAIASLAAEYRRKIPGVRTIGVTGSNGKTTTVRLIHAALKAACLRGTHSLKSHNNSLGVPLTILNAGPADDYLICEIGTSSPGEIRPLTEMVQPEIGVITSIGRAHLESLGSLAGVAHEKAELVRALDANAVAIVTGDSPELDAELAGQLPCRVLRIGTSSDSDVVVHSIETRNSQTSFLAGEHHLKVSLPGAHNACNAAIAIMVAETLGVDLEKAANGLAAAAGPEMRLEKSTLPIPGGNIHLINDAYNANPESMNAALHEFAAGSLDPDSKTTPSTPSTPTGRRIAVLGSMLELGDQADGAHKEIVERVAGLRSIDLTFFIGPDFARAQQDDPNFRFLAEDSGVDAIWPASVAARLAPGDILLLKGSRGARLERLIDAVCSQQPDAVD